ALEILTDNVDIRRPMRSAMTIGMQYPFCGCDSVGRSEGAMSLRTVCYLDGRLKDFVSGWLGETNLASFRIWRIVRTFLSRGCALQPRRDFACIAWSFTSPFLPLPSRLDLRPLLKKRRLHRLLRHHPRRLHPLRPEK